MIDTISVKPEEKQNANNLKDKEKNSKNEGQILEHNVKFLLTHFEQMDDNVYKSSNYKIKEIVSLKLGNRFFDYH